MQGSLGSQTSWFPWPPRAGEWEFPLVCLLLVLLQLSEGVDITSMLASFLDWLLWHVAAQVPSAQSSPCHSFQVPGDLFRPQPYLSPHLTLSLPRIALTHPTGMHPLHSPWAKQRVPKVLPEAHKSLLPKRWHFWGLPDSPKLFNGSSVPRAQAKALKIFLLLSEAICTPYNTTTVVSHYGKYLKMHWLNANFRKWLW